MTCAVIVAVTGPRPRRAVICSATIAVLAPRSPQAPIAIRSGILSTAGLAHQAHQTPGDRLNLAARGSGDRLDDRIGISDGISRRSELLVRLVPVT